MRRDSQVVREVKTFGGQVTQAENRRLLASGLQMLTWHIA